MLQKKEDIFFNNEFELAEIERHNGKATTKSPDENRAQLEEVIAILEAKLEVQHGANRSIDSLAYLCEAVLKRCRKKIELLDTLNEKDQ